MPLIVRSIALLILLAALPLPRAIATAQVGRERAVRTIRAEAVRITPGNGPMPRRGRPNTAVTTGLRVIAEGRRFLVPLTGRVGTWRIDSVASIAAAARADTTYLLAEVRGRSRGNDGTGQCGAGSEADLVWIKLARGGVAELRTAPVTSCWRGLNDEDEPYRRDADSLWFDAAIGPGNREVAIRYYFATPQRGMLSLVDTAATDSLPRYPGMLASARVEGDVIARIEPVRGSLRASVRIVEASHDLFRSAVSNSLSAWHVEGGPDSTARVVTVHTTFRLRHDEGCRSILSPKRPPFKPAGNRATIQPSSAAGDIRLRVEACWIEPMRAIAY